MLTRIGIALLVACTASRVLAGDRPDPSLADVKSFALVVEDVNPMGEKLGLTREAIRTFAGPTLRKAGLPVLHAKREKPHHAPYVYVQVTVVSSSGVAAFTVRVSFEQEALLLKDGQSDQRYGKPVVVETWSEQLTGMGTESDAYQLIKEATTKQVGKFVDAYRLANPDK
jgi:hypothetical protein